MYRPPPATTPMPPRDPATAAATGTFRARVILTIAWLVLFGAVYCGYVAWRTWPLYQNITTNQRGWTGRVHRADRILGFAPVPDSRGTETFPVGPAIPMRYDSRGFRIPVAAGDSARAASGARPVILALGCSYTYGAANLAEETYPWLVGRALGGTTMNAGVSGYGLAQMLILARRLVPSIKPDILLVQYSPWLSERAISPFAPAYFGKLPVPYFTADDDLRIHGPVFATRIMDLPVDRYRGSPGNVAAFTSFLLNVGFPLYLHDDWNMLLYAGRRLAGIVTEPAHDRRRIETLAYREICRIAHDEGARVVVVALGSTAQPLPVPDGIFPAGCLVINAQAALLQRLPAGGNEQSYREEYALWRGDPPRLVDIHPNAKAHRIIAGEIMRAIGNESVDY